MRSVRWRDFADAAPTLADAGRALLYHGGEGAALLATVRDGASPRIHPINVGVVNDGLYAFLLDSPKRRDLDADGRFALHAHQEPSAPSEFSLRGRAMPIDEGDVRGRVASEWYFGIDDEYRLFEFRIESALVGVRENADAWPPVYTKWRAG